MEDDKLDIFVSMAEREMRKREEEGFFQDLKSKGKKIDYSYNPFEPSEWRIFRALTKDSGLVPKEVELQRLKKELSEEVKSLSLKKTLNQEEQKHLLSLKKKLGLIEMEVNMRLENLRKK